MRVSLKISLSLLITLLFAHLIFAQSDSNSDKTNYTSDSGRFAISLPSNPTSQRQVPPTEKTSDGMQFFWRTKDGEFFVSYYDNLIKPINPKQELETMSNDYLSGIVKNSGKLLEKKEITLNKNTGLELKAVLKTSETVIIRYYSVDKRIFILSTRLSSKETGEKQLKVLDSFSLIGSNR